jgi:site-specific DNA-methyltransferase (adenine-specific)
MTDVATECLRVLKPGGHALAWAIPRTSHWTGTAWENAGFEARDKLYHVFGSGFPKSHDISAAIDREAGAVREVVGENPYASRRNLPSWGTLGKDAPITAPATPEAAQWDGWGTALKPAVEEWWLFRKPISEATVAANVLRWGVGALNIDASRVEYAGEQLPHYTKPGVASNGVTWKVGAMPSKEHPDSVRHDPAGRYPAHLLHDGSAEVVACFPQSTSTGGTPTEGVDGYGWKRSTTNQGGFGDTGSAARFFAAVPADAADVEALRLIYCAKASKADRDEGLEGFEAKFSPTTNTGIGGKEHDPETATPKRNHHPTVKATALMRHLVRLIAPPGGVVLDPFTGSGSTGKAAMIEGFRFIGIEREAEYIAIARARIESGLLPMFREAEPEFEPPQPAPPAVVQAGLFDEAA